MKKILFAIFLTLAATNVSRETFATVAEDNATDSYTGDDVTTAFVYNFKILNQDYIKVLVDGVVKTRGTHYTVSGVGNSAGGSVTFVTAPTTSAKVVLVRNSPVAQPTNYTANEAYNSSKVMADLDRLAILAQQLQEQLTRAYKVIEGYSQAALPNVCSGTQKMIGFDATGAVSCATDLNAAAATANQWDQITAPTGNAAFSHGNNRTAITYGAATGANPMLHLADTTGNTGSGAVLQVNTVGSSVALPFKATAQGTSNGVQMSSTGALAPIGSGTIAATSLSATLAIAGGGTGQVTQTAAFDGLDPLTTKGDVICHNGTNSIRLGVGSNNQTVIADSAQTCGFKWADADMLIVKSADETVNASAVLQNDDHLVFACAANTSYRFSLNLLMSAASGTPDFQIGWTVPASATMFWGAHSGAGARWDAVGTASSPATMLTEASAPTLGSVSGTFAAVYQGIVRCAGTAGNVQLQWAQNTSNASDSKFLKDSWLVVRKLQ